MEAYDRWYVLNSNGETPLDEYQRDPDNHGFPGNTFGLGYQHVLYHLLNDAVYQFNLDKVKMLLTKYGANPNTSNMHCYNGEALFMSMFHLKSNPIADEILHEFIKNGALYKNPKICHPFGYKPLSDITNLTNYVEEKWTNELKN